MDLKIIMPTEISHTEKETYYVYRSKLTDTENSGDYQRQRVGEMDEMFGVF